MSFKEENNELGKNFIKNMYLDYWESDEDNGNHNRIEIQTSYKCNLNCKYCYVDRHRDKLYNEVDDDDLYDNAEMLIDWLIENDYNPSIDYFGGEVFVNDINFKILNMILDKFKDKDSVPPKIVIPTNFTWIKSENITKKVDELIEKSRNIGVPIYLSASIDGKYCTENRPPIKFDDDDYQKLFKFCKKWKINFHPMIYSEEIENWKDNWLWFQDWLEKTDRPFDSIYLLEVRNREWTKGQINEFQDYIKWLIDWTINKVGKDELVKFIFDDGYNILRTPFTTIGRGMGCSMQASLFVRLSDLTFNICHRLSYDEFELGHFVYDDKIDDLVVDKPELLIGTKSLDQKTYPGCEDCPINYMCSGQCLGAMYEYTGDMYTPIPNVCRLELAKIKSIIEKFKDENMLDEVKRYVNSNILKQIEWMEEQI